MIFSAKFTSLIAFSPNLVNASPVSSKMSLPPPGKNNPLIPSKIFSNSFTSSSYLIGTILAPADSKAFTYEAAI